MKQTVWYALGVWDPWATALVRGWKDVENRDWQNAPSLRTIARSLRGQRLVIHATKTFQAAGVPIIRRLAGQEVRRADCHPGHLIGTVTVDDFLERSTSPWYAPGSQVIAVRRAQAVAFPQPIRMIGRQGFIRLNPEQVDAVLAQLHARGVAA